PNYIWHILLRAAILGNPERRLTLAGIYEEIGNKFPYYTETPTETWKQSVRHNLSRLNMFVKIERQAGELGSSSYWTVDL
ncbi:winged helix DNA-binding domain-containing protein, partial [Peniophora sp. CONT]